MDTTYFTVSQTIYRAIGRRFRQVSANLCFRFFGRRLVYGQVHVFDHRTEGIIINARSRNNYKKLTFSVEFGGIIILE